MTAPGNVTTIWPPAPGAEVSGRRYVFALPARAESAAYARSRTLARLARWNVDEGTREAAAMVMSGLATDAVAHTDGESILCELGDHGLRLYVAVHGQGVGRDSPWGDPNPAVRALAEAWGSRDAEPGHGRVVWAELPYGAAMA